MRAAHTARVVLSFIVNSPPPKGGLSLSLADDLIVVDRAEELRVRFVLKNTHDEAAHDPSARGIGIGIGIGVGGREYLAQHLDYNRPGTAQHEFAHSTTISIAMVHPATLYHLTALLHIPLHTFQDLVWRDVERAWHQQVSDDLTSLQRTHCPITPPTFHPTPPPPPLPPRTSSAHTPDRSYRGSPVH